MRVWSASRNLFVLSSTSTGARWNTDGGATFAVCPRRSGAAHSPPVKDCTCGLYAWHPHRVVGLIARQMRQAVPRKVFGLIEAWGRIEIHSAGFRAEFARPVAFVNLDWQEIDERAGGQMRAHYETRLWELAERCGAEVIDPCEGESVRQLLKYDQRALSAATIRDLISSGRRSI